MPKQGRVNDTIQFLRTAVVQPNAADPLRQPISEWLEEIPISPAIDQGMSQGTAGTELTRKYRRAMILILCALNNVPVTRAQQVVAQYRDPNLQSALGTMLLDVARICVPRRLDPPKQQLLAAPAAFLAANRIKTGNGGLNISTASQYEFSWDARGQFYLMEPPVVFHQNLHVQFPGFNIAVTKFTDIANLGQITGAVVTGNIGITTQLSGCSILYSVNGGNLVAAHVWPNQAAPVRSNLPGALVGQAGLPAGVILALRLAHQGALGNALVGGTFGIFGMVNDLGDTGLRAVGPNNVRMHGYVATEGNAYFIAVKVGGNWHLFGQQNNPGRPGDGVSTFQQIYP